MLIIKCDFSGNNGKITFLDIRKNYTIFDYVLLRKFFPLGILSYTQTDVTDKKNSFSISNDLIFPKKRIFRAKNNSVFQRIIHL
jgi:hypothetical protein